jgi:hypothetical protein
MLFFKKKKVHPLFFFFRVRSPGLPNNTSKAVVNALGWYRRVFKKGLQALGGFSGGFINLKER